MSDPVATILDALSHVTVEQRRDVFVRLRREFPIHVLEQKLNVQAEIILEAIDRASDLTLRGIRGIIAECVFTSEVVAPLTQSGWLVQEILGNMPYDAILSDEHGVVRVQVKMQRQIRHQPYMRKGMYVVETQRTRNGREVALDGTIRSTRPYRYGEFDILAVSMQASSGRWTDMRYTVGDWLLPRPTDPTLLRVLQPVPLQPNSDWTDDFLTAVSWFRSRQKKQIRAI